MRYDPVIRSAVLALLTYGLGLIPFYFFTPVHDTISAMIRPPIQSVAFAPALAPTPAVVVVASTTPRPAATVVVDVKAKIGADTISVAGPTAAVPQPIEALPADTGHDSRYAFLLLGYGGPGHDGAYLTDSIMLVIVDPDRKTLSLVSLPRDSWVPLMFDGTSVVYNKVNTAYALANDSSLFTDRLSRYAGDQGAGNFAADTISRLVGVPIRYYMGLDFTGFRQMIDAVGGIDVDVAASFAARYPANDNSSIDPSWTVVRFTKGTQHMGGERAIQYARARETLDNIDEGTDFARSRRQRLILEAFKQRVFQPGGMVHLPQLLGIGASHVATNYSVPDVANLSKLALDWKDVTIFQTAISGQNYLEDATGPEGTYALVPSSASHSWAQIRAFVNRLWKDPAAGVAMSNAQIVVENDTGVAGTATQVTSVLENLGYNLASPTSGAFRSDSRLVDGRDQHLGKALAPLLAADLGISNLVVDDSIPAQPGVILLLLGANDLAVAKVTVPVDTGAPSSTVGIDKFGVWAPATDVPTVSAETPTPSEPRNTTTTTTRVASVVSGTPLTGTPTIGNGSVTTTPMVTAGTQTASVSITATSTGSPVRPTATPTPLPITPTAVPRTSTVVPSSATSVPPTPTRAPTTPTKAPPTATIRPTATATARPVVSPIPQG